MFAVITPDGNGVGARLRQFKGKPNPLVDGFKQGEP
jgi:hypothetical protein